MTGLPESLDYEDKPVLCAVHNTPAFTDIAQALVYNVKAHTSAVRDVTYHSRHDSNEHDFASCGQDGRVRCFDDRDPWTGATYWKNRGTSFIHSAFQKQDMYIH